MTDIIRDIPSIDAITASMNAFIDEHNLAKVDPEPTHYHTAELYGRRLVVPTGTVFTTKVHKSDHIAVCLRGHIVIFKEDGQRFEVKAPDVFITVTLKRGLLDVHGIWQNMDAYQAERTGEIIKDRIIKKISVKGILERPQIPFFTSYEVASGNWNPHLHAVSLIPTGMSFEEYDERCRRAISHLDWVNDQIDIRPLTYSKDESWSGACNYILKNGTDSLLPMACQVPKSLSGRCS